MATLVEIQNQIASLEEEAVRVRAAEIGPAIEKIKGLMSLYKISVTDLGFKESSERNTGTSTPEKSGKKADIKFRDNDGNSWSGRGLKPKWLSSALANGRSLDEFQVAPRSFDACG